MDVGISLLMLFAALETATANVNKTDTYAPPPNTVLIETCQLEALRLHPGMIDSLLVLPKQKTFWIHYQIQMRNGAEWSVVCDLAIGKIIHDQNLNVALPHSLAV